MRNAGFAKTLITCFAAIAIAGITAGIYADYTTEQLKTLFKEYTFQDSDGKIPYRLFSPKNYDKSKKYPLVLWFHGAGRRGSDNDLPIFKKSAPGAGATFCINNGYDEKYPAFILVPQCPANNQWVDWSWGKGSYSIDNVKESNEMRIVVKILAKMQNDFSVDSNRMYVTGQSMGGFGAWDIMLRHPEIFAAGIIICGGGDPSKAALIKHIPQQVFHGTKDGTVPIKASEEMVAALKAAGANPIFTKVDGGHTIWNGVYNNTEGLVDWFFAQSKDGAVVSHNKSGDMRIIRNYKPQNFVSFVNLLGRQIQYTSRGRSDRASATVIGFDAMNNGRRIQKEIR
jgi:predicted peptidase